jgi:DNA polymerase-3 subunit gamma/tau
MKKKLNLQDKQSSADSNEDNIFDGDWIKLVDNLRVGLAKSLAQECSLVSYEDCVFNLVLNTKFQHLTQNGYIEKLEEVLINYFNRKIKVNISLGSDLKTPSMQKKLESAELKKTTESAIMEDDFVKELIEGFGAEVVSSSIEPTKKKGK